MDAQPSSGKSLRDSAADRPLMAALDLLGRRWALRILWELRDGAVGARDLRGRCDEMSSSVMYDRLRELTDAGLVEKDLVGLYVLTAVGEGLSGAIAPLDYWAKSWAHALGSEPSLWNV